MIHARSMRAVLPLALLLASFGEASDLDQQIQCRLSAAQIPVERINEPLRGRVDEILRNPTLFVRGPTEAFPCRPGVYQWLLDEPDWTIAGWQALANTPISIERQPDGSFLGRDRQGGSLRWQCVVNQPGKRVWYAEGTGRMAPLLPPMTLKAVLCLKYQEVVGDDGRVGIRHRTEAFAQFDAKSASWFTRFLGLTTEDCGKKVLEQIEIFHSGMAYYLSEHPEWGQRVLSQRAITNEDRQKYEQLQQELTLVGRTAPRPRSAPRQYPGLTPTSSPAIGPRP